MFPEIGTPPLQREFHTPQLRVEILTIEEGLGIENFTYVKTEPRSGQDTVVACSRLRH
jgi:hypothetical protein